MNIRQRRAEDLYQVPASARSTSEFEGPMCSGYPIYMKS